MAKGKPYRRLSLKLLAMLLLAAMAAIALGLTLQVLGDYLVERVYCSEKRQNLRLFPDLCPGGGCLLHQCAKNRRLEP